MAALRTSRMPRSVLTPRPGVPSTIMLTRIIRFGMGPPSVNRGGVELAACIVAVALQPADSAAAPATPACFTDYLRLPSMALLLLGSTGFAVILAQLALEHFSDGAARQALHDAHRRQALDFAEAAVGPLQHRLGVGRAGPGDDERDRRLAPLRRRPPHHRDVGHLGMGGQHGLEVARVDVEAARDDHVLLAVEQHEEAVGVEAADGAGADEELAGGVETVC